ncbi:MULTISPECIES: anti-sigma factor [Paraburkholderia]|uniref:anti-sigma factor n=1 Tax=Paraburkholderia TaxID=1822464 RepID=UPI00036F8028|nr:MULTISPECIES: anti-sigma factor [Paraburkholderia]MDH6146892.1 anti-sigma-K factor RskA [Paraburkholderia sp. WSM4179]
MNTPIQPDDNLRCAEYALGVLDTDSRRALEREAARDAALRETLDAWLVRLTPLAESLPAVEPSARVWTRIQHDLGFLAAAPPARSGWWDSLTLWRWLGIGASMAALVLLGVNFFAVHEMQQRAAVVAQNGYMVATIARSDGVASWTATVDFQRANMVIVPAATPKIAADRSTELWLIPAGAKPIPLGVFSPGTPVSVQLPPQTVSRIVAKAVLAVSLEPQGGSPTGQPSGPVLATGELNPT